MRSNAPHMCTYEKLAVSPELSAASFCERITRDTNILWTWVFLWSPDHMDFSDLPKRYTDFSSGGAFVERDCLVVTTDRLLLKGLMPLFQRRRCLSANVSYPNTTFLNTGSGWYILFPRNRQVLLDGYVTSLQLFPQRASLGFSTLTIISIIGNSWEHFMFIFISLFFTLYVRINVSIACDNNFNFKVSFSKVCFVSLPLTVDPLGSKQRDNKISKQRARLFLTLFSPRDRDVIYTSLGSPLAICKATSSRKKRCTHYCATSSFLFEISP